MIDTTRIALILLLNILPAFTLPGSAQDTQEAFESQLIVSCQENDIAKLHLLVTENRLWVKPIVNQLITDHIDLVMAGRESAAVSKRETAILIAQTFHEIFGEASLMIATGYLDLWDMEELGKKAQADRIYGMATDLRKKGTETEKAIETFHRALELYTEIGDIRGEGEVLGGLGFIYWSGKNETL